MSDRLLNKMLPELFSVLSLFLISCKGAGGLRATELQISPPIVQRGSDATLACLYELHDAPLYSVKWYRGRYEFYRYSPTEIPHTKIFPFAGINVDLARSNESQVVLVRVSFGLSGNFSCEVTADAPSFSTSYVSAHMDVVALPAEAPALSAEHERYEPGVLLRATCVSSPSRPATTLRMRLNDVEITTGQLRGHQTADGLTRNEFSILVPLTPEHFERGPPLLFCEGSVANGTLYRKYTELVLQPVSGHPRIERVTSSCSPSSLLGEDLTFALLLVALSSLSLW